MSESPQPISPIALVALLTGAIGLAFSFLGCLFSPFLFVAAALCLVAIVLGAVEVNKVNAGQSAPSNKTFALAGLATGLGGCAIGLLYVVFVVVLFVLYFVFVFGIVLFSALAGGGP